MESKKSSAVQEVASACANIKLHDEEFDEIKAKWEREQEEMKDRCVIKDVYEWQTQRVVKDYRTLRDPVSFDSVDSVNTVPPLTYVGGVDISFIKGDDVNACAALVIIQFPSLKVVYEDITMVKLTAPYIPGFLAFREADCLVEKVNKLRNSGSEFLPQAIIVDGNGILHPRGFGLACHMGVQLGIPSLGVSKTLYHVDGIENDENHHEKIRTLLLKGGDTFPLVGNSGKTLGMALRTCDRAPNPVYVSPGHLISLETAVWLAQQCSRYRIPEPTRQADLRSREYIRQNWPPKSDQGVAKCPRLNGCIALI